MRKQSIDDLPGMDSVFSAEGAHTQSAGETEELRKYLLFRFWTTAKGFWSRNHGDRLAWLLTGSLFVLIFANLAAQFGINLWNRKIFDALEQRDSAAVLFLSFVFFPLAAASVAIGVTNVWARMTTQRRWRAWVSDAVISRWLTNGRYYQLNLVAGDHQNPGGRLTDDLRVSTDAPVDFAVGVIQASLSAITFIAVLWSIGGALSFTLGGVAITIPGFLVIAAILYAALASGAMTIVGKKFVAVSEAKNQAEATYRYQLTRVREYGESIALLGGEAEERAGIDRSLGAVLWRWRSLCHQHMKTTVVSQGSHMLAAVIPIILCAPKFLDGTMSLGQVMQAASAFTIVQSAFSWLVDNYPRLADWNASARRLASLMVSLDHLEQAETGDAINRIKRSETKDAAMKLLNLSVSLDDGTAVVDDTEVVIQKGERVLIAGESGTGKSTLVRAIAGLWPWGGGEISIQHNSRLFLLPQRPYVPTGTLRRAVAYPGAAGRLGPGADQGDIGQSRARPSERTAGRRGAVGSDAVGRREAAPDGGARAAAPARHYRAGRGDLRARSERAGHADAAFVRRDGGFDHYQRRTSAGAGALPSAQAGARTPPRRRQADQRLAVAGQTGSGQLGSGA